MASYLIHTTLKNLSSVKLSCTTILNIYDFTSSCSSQLILSFIVSYLPLPNDLPRQYRSTTKAMQCFVEWHSTTAVTCTTFEQTIVSHKPLQFIVPSVSVCYCTKTAVTSILLVMWLVFAITN